MTTRVIEDPPSTMQKRTSAGPRPPGYRLTQVLDQIGARRCFAGLRKKDTAFFGLVVVFTVAAAYQYYYEDLDALAFLAGLFDCLGMTIWALERRMRGRDSELSSISLGLVVCVMGIRVTHDVMHDFSVLPEEACTLAMALVLLLHSCTLCTNALCCLPALLAVGLTTNGLFSSHIACAFTVEAFAHIPQLFTVTPFQFANEVTVHPLAAAALTATGMGRVMRFLHWVLSGYLEEPFIFPHPFERRLGLWCGLVSSPYVVVLHIIQICFFLKFISLGFLPAFFAHRPVRV